MNKSNDKIIHLVSPPGDFILTHVLDHYECQFISKSTKNENIIFPNHLTLDIEIDEKIATIMVQSYYDGKEYGINSTKARLRQGVRDFFSFIDM